MNQICMKYYIRFPFISYQIRFSFLATKTNFYFFCKIKISGDIKTNPGPVPEYLYFSILKQCKNLFSKSSSILRRIVWLINKKAWLGCNNHAKLRSFDNDKHQAFRFNRINDEKKWRGVLLLVSKMLKPRKRFDSSKMSNMFDNVIKSNDLMGKTFYIYITIPAKAKQIL